MDTREKELPLPVYDRRSKADELPGSREEIQNYIFFVPFFPNKTFYLRYWVERTEETLGPWLAIAPLGKIAREIRGLKQRRSMKGGARPRGFNLSCSRSRGERERRGQISGPLPGHLPPDRGHQKASRASSDFALEEVARARSQTNQNHVVLSFM
ncbi:hypothetical protein CRG98_007561 [Punica granatum]|uniref:Uncharacterized protein n=1 Tax=Punica granatum TaxID=22663 RepID=A0A2I0KU60_PUNGR|nr:hypothetical protein CRG98_007561 [Punica granatum]